MNVRKTHAHTHNVRVIFARDGSSKAKFDFGSTHPSSRVFLAVCGVGLIYSPHLPLSYCATLWDLTTTTLPKLAKRILPPRYTPTQRHIPPCSSRQVSFDTTLVSLVKRPSLSVSHTRDFPGSVPGSVPVLGQKRVFPHVLFRSVGRTLEAWVGRGTLPPSQTFPSSP